MLPLRVLISQLKIKPFFLAVGAVLSAATVYAAYQSVNLTQQINLLQDNQAQATKKLEDAAFQEHLAFMEKEKFIESQKQAGISQEDKDRLAKIDQIDSLYKDINSKISRDDAAKVTTSDISSQIPDWGKQFLAGDLDNLITSMSGAVKTLDQRYQATLPKTTTTTVNPTGYSSVTVSTSRGSFSISLIKLALGSYAVKTVSANSSNCTASCPAKSLAEYVAENGAYAGMNGNYFCPPDYSACAGKTNSYDSPVYNSNLGKWLNSAALAWTSIGLATFNGASPKFYRYNNQYPGSAVTAGISNFPLLLQSGAVIDSTAEQTDYQKLKGTRGSIGTDGTYIYLALVKNASVLDSAYALQALGVKDALNLDGGGSAALYIGGVYKAGPGRLLPNAVVVVKR